MAAAAAAAAVAQAAALKLELELPPPQRQRQQPSSYLPSGEELAMMPGANDAEGNGVPWFQQLPLRSSSSGGAIHHAASSRPAAAAAAVAAAGGEARARATAVAGAPAVAEQGQPETIHELMHVGKEVDLTKPRRPPMMDESLPVCKDKMMCFL